MNTGGANVAIANVSVSGSGFDASGISTGQILPPGSSATLTVVFDPATTGNAIGNINISSDAPESSITLSGTGAVAQAHSVSLSWTPSSSVVSGYNVWRSTVSGGPYSKLTTTPVSAANYADTGVFSADTYYYVITSVNSNSVDSAYSNEVSATVPTP